MKQVPVDDGGSGPTFTIGAGLPPDQEEALAGFLCENKDVLAWEATDLVGVPRDVMEHHLVVCPGARPVKQKARWQAPEKQSFIVQEVHKLQEDDVIREVPHLDWLANPFIVPKKGGKERYHQIKMAVQDIEKTVFLSPCELGRNAEAYVDDIVVKSREERTLVEDSEETFANLRKVNLRLNPEKCMFGVPSGKLLDFLVSHREIEANPEKIKAIEKMSPPQTLKEMQKLAGCVTSLGRFISKLGERALPFFKLMKKKAFQLEFSTTWVIKGATLTDFVAEWTDAPDRGVGEDRSLTPGDEAPDSWVMYFDDAFAHQGTGARAVSNNITEYEGLIAGVRVAAALGVRRLTIKGDSQLLVKFSNKE
nr:uncharacterized protein LOC109762500 [Aegilops tauschii subsp. strangulata]